MPAESLSRLASAVRGSRLASRGDVAVTGIAYDSRRVRPGELFVAVAGAVHDGRAFVGDAVDRGAAAVASETDPGPTAQGRPWLQVPDARGALAALARAYHHAPDERLVMVGITGTNGKTTTAILLAAACEAAGLPAGVVGTLGVAAGCDPRTGVDFRPTAHTTPEAPDLYAALDEIAAAGRRAAVLEVSSHALALQRVEGMQFDVAVFTNLTRDHLDFHENMDNYFAAKARLFAGLPPDAAMAVNLDDPFGTRLVPPSRPRVVTYGRATRADILPLKIDSSRAGLRLELATPAGRLEVESPLVGQPNVYNILATVAAAHALDLDPDKAAEGIARVRAIPGRAQLIDEGQDFLVFVDYAHTDDALVNVLGAARELSTSRVIVVFGCGGDRDRTKRPLMGAAAARLADVAILTSDNPRSEDPQAIIAEVATGFDATGARAARRIEPDRAVAIALAIHEARPGDVVVIAGKGHEAEQILADGRVPFDDREVARDALRARFARES
jgi:UDP-N-acetylmuramoyl-L-alanyl-D-glutamate--2,6-diaminopimelate ligase